MDPDSIFVLLDGKYQWTNGGLHKYWLNSSYPFKINHHSWCNVGTSSCKSTSAYNELKAGLDELIQVFHRQGPAWTMEWWTNPGTRWIAMDSHPPYDPMKDGAPWDTMSTCIVSMLVAGPTSPSFKFSLNYCKNTRTLGRRLSILWWIGTLLLGQWVFFFVPWLNDLARGRHLSVRLWPWADSQVAGDGFFAIQWIGLRENLQENPIFNGKIYGFRLRFSLKPIHWAMLCPWLWANEFKTWLLKEGFWIERTQWISMVWRRDDHLHHLLHNAGAASKMEMASECNIMQYNMILITVPYGTHFTPRIANQEKGTTCHDYTWKVGVYLLLPKRIWVKFQGQ